MWPCCHGDYTRANRTAGCIINHLCSFPRFADCFSSGGGVNEGEREGEGEPLSNPPPHSQPPLPPSGCLSRKKNKKKQMGVAALVTSTPASFANKDDSVGASSSQTALTPPNTSDRFPWRQLHPASAHTPDQAEHLRQKKSARTPAANARSAHLGPCSWPPAERRRRRRDPPTPPPGFTGSVPLHFISLDLY